MRDATIYIKCNAGDTTLTQMSSPRLKLHRPGNQTGNHSVPSRSRYSARYTGGRAEAAPLAAGSSQSNQAPHPSRSTVNPAHIQHIVNQAQQCLLAVMIFPDNPVPDPCIPAIIPDTRYMLSEYVPNRLHHAVKRRMPLRRCFRFVLAFRRGGCFRRHGCFCRFYCFC